LLRDATDAPILGTALAGRADILCTRDADLFEERVQRFCAAKGIRLLTELEFLQALDA
jgi:predicted nucleic acid-binding protein